MTIASMVGSSRADLTIWTVAFERSPVRAMSGIVVTAPRDAEDLCCRIRSETSPQILLIDDAEAIEDPSGALARLLGDRLDHLRVVVAGRADSLRIAFGHWTQMARRSGSGIILGTVSSCRRRPLAPPGTSDAARGPAGSRAHPHQRKVATLPSCHSLSTHQNLGGGVLDASQGIAQRPRRRGIQPLDVVDGNDRWSPVCERPERVRAAIALRSGSASKMNLNRFTSTRSKMSRSPRPEFDISSWDGREASTS